MAKILEVSPIEDGELLEGDAFIEVGDDEVEEVGPAKIGDGGWFDNLAENLSDSELTRIGEDLCDRIDTDLRSRSDWEERQKKGLEFLGLKDLDTAGRPEGTATVTHPLMMEASVQFQARAVEEILPAQGPAKGQVMGDATDDLVDQSYRVENYMNYHLMVEDVPYFEDTEAMLMALPWQGSCFKKVYRDHLLKRNVSRYVKADDVIVPYDAKSERDTPRLTHRFTLEKNNLKKFQVQGLYRDVEIGEAQDTAGEHGNLKEEREEVIGQEAERADSDNVYTMYECHCLLDIGDNDDGIEMPYIVTIESETRTIFSITRNWDEDDETADRFQYFVHYRYLPGYGFYGFGLPHVIGGLAAAATGTLRALLDSATFANFQGGFKSRDSRMRSGHFQLTPGVWTEVEASFDDLQKSFYTPPFKEPSVAMFQLLGFLEEGGRRFASTTETMVGAADNRGPVGTTLALIEQGSKIYTGIHKRTHNSQGQELRLLFKLHGEHTPEDGYPYLVAGASREIMAADFDEFVDVVPVSDPNIISQAQRIAIEQAVLDMAEKAPALYDMRQVHTRMHKALRTPDYESLFVNEDNILPADPITENMAILTGRPVKVFEEQDHQAHMMAHVAFMEHPQFGGQQTAAQIIGPAIIAHLAEHLAFQYKRNHEMIGVPTLPVDLDAEPGEPMTIQDPQAQDMVAQMAARAVEQFKQTTGIATQPQPQEPDKAMMAQQLHEQKMQHLQEQHQIKMGQDMERFQQKLMESIKEHMQELSQDAQVHQQEIQQTAEEFAQEQKIKAAEAEGEIERKAVVLDAQLNLEDVKNQDERQKTAAAALGEEVRADRKAKQDLKTAAMKSTLDIETMKQKAQQEPKDEGVDTKGD